MKFVGIDTQERARELTGTEVFFPRHLTENDEEAEMSMAQIVGFSIVNDADGRVVGKVESIDDSTVNTLFELDNGILIPATDDMVTEIDAEKRVIRMTLPEGLLEL